jgi:general secretion pathway protein K
MNPVDADNLKELVSNSTMDAAYFTTIEDEGSKIDVNDLVSKSKVLRETAQQQLMRIFEQKILEDRDFERRLENLRPEDIVNNIADYIRSSQQSARGGTKQGNYSEINRLAGKDLFPPNRGFRTLDELRFVPGITDEVFQLLSPRITIFGMKGINPNLATKEVLKSLDTGFTDELVSELIKRRDDLNLGGPFQTADDFWNYVRQMRGQINGDPTQIPLIFDSITNFKIRSTGEFAGASREITAIVMDVDRVAQKVADQLIAEKAELEGKEPPKKDPKAAAKKTQTKGPPRIVSWDER